MSTPEMPDINVKISDKFHDFALSGYWGGIRSYGVEFTVYSEKLDFFDAFASQTPKNSKAKVERIIEANIRIDPLQLVSFHSWLGKKIEEYRAIFGQIPSPEEIQHRQKELNEKEKD